MTVKNPTYRKFLDHNELEVLTENDIKTVLDNIHDKEQAQARAIIITLYYTGARPNEVLRLKFKDFSTNKGYLDISLKGSKGGLPRTVSLQLKLEMVKELSHYVRNGHPEMYAFWKYKGKYKRKREGKHGVKEYTEIADKFRYHFVKWFSVLYPDSIPPYVLRHSRFTQMMIAGLSAEDVRLWKGSKRMDSVTPYLHFSRAQARKSGSKVR